MIYICYIIYYDDVVTCVLAVRDDDDDALPEAADGGHVWES
jgi:hypothetical protein